MQPSITIPELQRKGIKYTMYWGDDSHEQAVMLMNIRNAHKVHESTRSGYVRPDATVCAMYDGQYGKGYQIIRFKTTARVTVEYFIVEDK